MKLYICFHQSGDCTLWTRNPAEELRQFIADDQANAVIARQTFVVDKNSMAHQALLAIMSIENLHVNTLDAGERNTIMEQLMLTAFEMGREVGKAK